MGKRRITLIVDDDNKASWCTDLGDQRNWSRDSGVTVESVEDVPDPIVQEFVVTTTSAPNVGPLVPDAVRVCLERLFISGRTFDVTEVEP